MRRQRSRSLALALAVLGGGALLAACLPPAPPPPPPVLVTTTTTVDPPAVDGGSIMGPSQLTAAQIAAYVCHVGHCPASPATAQSWKPEITPTQMAQLYIDEGNLVGVRGDVAFCQSVLETGWFAWSSSFAHLNDPPVASNDPNFAIWPGFTLPSDHNYAGDRRVRRQPRLHAPGHRAAGCARAVAAPPQLCGLDVDARQPRRAVRSASRLHDDELRRRSCTTARRRTGSTSTASGPSPVPPTGRRSCRSATRCGRSRASRRSRSRPRPASARSRCSPRSTPQP